MVQTRNATRSSLSSHVFEIFFLHGGLEFVTTDKLLSTVGAASREFKRQARREFNSRLTRCHPSLVDAVAVGPDNIDSIGWKEWCRFELGERESRERGESMSLTANDFADIDVLLEVTMDGSGLVWHGCTPLRRRGEYLFPDADFVVPKLVFDIPKPAARELHRFESPSLEFPYHYWSGHNDVSMNQKTLCKALFGINSRALLHVHVVLRKRSNGKMLTVLSAHEPDEIMGECCGHNIGDYLVSYCNRESLFDDDDRVCAAVSFDVTCSEKVDETQQSVHFTTENEASFSFRVADYDSNEDGEETVLQAMRSWKWD
eukprot:scaffold2407_cov57-Cyclotella_meneghiniana.AAC.10